MKRQLVKGSASQILDIFIRDSSSTTGAGLTGLLFNTASLTCYYHRNSAAAGVAVSLVTMTVGTFTSSGFKEVDATNLPGLYQLCLPDAAYVTGATSVSAVLKGATNMAPLPLEIELTGLDNQDAVRAGLTALPNAAAEASGGLYTRGTGAGQITQPSNGLISANATQFAGQTITAAAGVTLPTSVASPTNITAGTITTVTNLTNAPTAGDLTATMKTSVTTAATAATPIAASVTGAVGSVTGSVGSIATGGIAAASFAAGAIDAAAIAANAIGASELATDAVAEIADQVWDELLSGHAISGSTGAALSTAGSAGDPWSTALPGAYGAGTAGLIVGTNLDATVSSRGTADTGDAMTLASGSITAAVVATGAIDADALATDAVNEIADGFLKRDWTAISGEPAEFSAWNALRFVRGLWNIVAGVLHVFKEDGVTDAWTSDLTTNASADPVTGSDTV